MNNNKEGGFSETFRTVFYAVLIALVVRTFGFEPFNIPSGSMIPTLLVGDYLFVSKYTYGYSRHSFPFSLPVVPGRIWSSAPERGDVVVFKLPTDNKTDYIKRVVGLPGDVVQVRGGILYINGSPVERKLMDDFVIRDNQGNAMRFNQYMETLPGGYQHVIIEKSDQELLDDTGEFVVPEGNYFMMGDNRDMSSDSRARVGYVPFENLVGKARFLFFSTDGSAAWFEFWKWPMAIRFSRLFTKIH